MELEKELDPDPHDNVCGFETLQVSSIPFFLHKSHYFKFTFFKLLF